MKSISECRLYGIIDTGYVTVERLASITRELIAGGVDILQLRAKKQSVVEILAMARELAPLCRAAGIPFILNDHPELVREAGADGAHVGQDDMSVAEARRLTGSGALIGKSTHSLEQARAAASESPDYIGFGPLFATPTKPDYAPIGTHEIRAANGLPGLPVFCIGGIRLDNLPDVIDAGARRVVIVSDLLLSPNPSARTASCKQLLEESAKITL
jgi:thiamine-phosphate pyrophosphorylase